MNKNYLNDFDDTLMTNHVITQPPPWNIYPTKLNPLPTFWQTTSPHLHNVFEKAFNLPHQGGRVETEIPA